MKLNIKILVGIPGSGKTTWSKECVFNNPNTKRINRDDLRIMFDGGKFTDGNENFLRVMKLELINICLKYNKNIIIDDTNCNYEKLIDLIRIIKTNSELLNKEINIDIIDFNINLDDCIFRDNNRENHVGINVLKHMQTAKNEIIFESLLVDKCIKITN